MESVYPYFSSILEFLCLDSRFIKKCPNYSFNFDKQFCLHFYAKNKFCGEEKYIHCFYKKVRVNLETIVKEWISENRIIIVLLYNVLLGIESESWVNLIE